MYPVDREHAYLIEPYGTTAGREIPHTGDDWARLNKSAKTMPELLSCYAGTVLSAGVHGVAGLRTVIDYDHLPIFGVYGHQSRIDVAPGDRVREGQRIGLMGATGRTTGVHLHYSEHTSLERADAGIYPYWIGAGLTLAQWASASGLVRPDYHRPTPWNEDSMTEKDYEALIEQLRRTEDAAKAAREAAKGAQSDAVWLKQRLGGRVATGVASITDMLRAALRTAGGAA